MGKIGILTYHKGYNFGASLQAYALQTKILSYGWECEIIDYEPDGMIKQRALFPLPPHSIRDFIKVVTRLPYYKDVKRRKKHFDDFAKVHLILSEKCETENDVVRIAEKYDIIICGSDQIWNLDPKMSDYGSLIYFLNFPKKQRRVAYAASFGNWVAKANLMEAKFLPYLKQFDEISVRESSGEEYIKSLGLNCETVLDPTLLIFKSEYLRILKEPEIYDPYLLLISWECGDNIAKLAKKISQESKLKLIHINPPPKGMLRGIKRKIDIGPSEFIGLINNAEYIITDSFHGTALSIIFEKRFLYVYEKEPDTRMESLLVNLGLTSCMHKSTNMDYQALFEIKYKDIETKIKNKRVTSERFLMKAIGYQEE